MTGRRYGRLVVTGEVGRTPAGQIRWACRCDCGGMAMVPGGHLRTGNTKSCGCEQHRGLEPYHKIRHGQANRTPTYQSWGAAIQRCTNPKNRYWHIYGGRGIQVCEAWKTSFEVFFADMGERPLGYTLDRINSDGDYEPGNCRWATAKQNGRNRRDVKLSESAAASIRQAYAAGGVTHRQLADAYGVSHATIGQLIRGRTWI